MKLFDRAIVLAMAGVAAAAVLAQEAPQATGIREVVVYRDPPRNGLAVYTVRLTPTETRTYDYLLFDCQLHQEFMFTGTDGRRTLKVIEPVTFTHRERKVKLVAELDKYVSFRVPAEGEELRLAYGQFTFTTNAPVLISRVKITAFADKKPAWTFESDVAGERLPP